MWQVIHLYIIVQANCHILTKKARSWVELWDYSTGMPWIKATFIIINNSNERRHTVLIKSSDTAYQRQKVGWIVMMEHLVSYCDFLHYSMWVRSDWKFTAPLYSNKDLWHVQAVSNSSELSFAKFQKIYWEEDLLR